MGGYSSSDPSMGTDWRARRMNRVSNNQWPGSSAPSPQPPMQPPAGGFGNGWPHGGGNHQGPSPQPPMQPPAQGNNDLRSRFQEYFTQHGPGTQAGPGDGFASFLNGLFGMLRDRATP